MNNFPKIEQAIAIHWFRRDLRLEDNHALFQALSSGLPVLPIFIFDSRVLSHFPNTSDKRVSYIYDALTKLNEQLRTIGSSLLVLHGTPEEIWENICSKYTVKQVFFNTDYEPYARNRDTEIRMFLEKNNISVSEYKDQVIFEKNEVVKSDGLPYTVFTPYSNRWKSQLLEIKHFGSEKLIHNFINTEFNPISDLNQIGYQYTTYHIPSQANVLDEKILSYEQTRDIPAIDGTTRQSVHLRFGTISVRQLAQKAKLLNEKYLNELIWREFYMQILWHFPHVEKSAFKKKYDLIAWRNNEAEFERWCTAQTGFPIIDAGINELLQTGHMHNRVRMIVSSFLTKNLLIDWRWGEAFFAQHLLDFELSSNNGGWQWAAGSGVDAAPYFRIFNPNEQTRKFDPKGEYIRTWVPHFNTFSYPQPMVELDFTRKRALEVYQQAVKI